MTRMQAFSAATENPSMAKFYALLAAVMVMAPLAMATLSQAAQIVA
ncbi:MAG: hypothetical protein NW206_01215 [Hyphomonadaceae bacterium]|nr:hypothetical protein [Hyphomonadaceae bacterium]